LSDWDWAGTNVPQYRDWTAIRNALAETEMQTVADRVKLGPNNARVNAIRPVIQWQSSTLTADCQPMLPGVTRLAILVAHLHLVCDGKKEIGHATVDPAVC